MNNIKERLLNLASTFENLNMNPMKAEILDIISEIEQYEKESTKWSVEDFEGRAQHHFGYKWRNTYDESKFQETLEHMISKHDACYGITWDTIDYYLDEYCIKEEKKIK